MRRSGNFALIQCARARIYDVSVAVEPVIGLVGPVNKAVRVLTPKFRVSPYPIAERYGYRGNRVGQFIALA